jgi:hypothetical protein
MPNSPGLVDPCEAQTRIHFALDPQDMVNSGNRIIHGQVGGVSCQNFA